MYRIIIADDHPVVRTGVKLVAESTGLCQVAAEASNSRGLLAAIETERPDFIVTDLSMDHENSTDGLAMIRFIRRRFPRVGLIVLTSTGGEVVINSLVTLGVGGVVSKRDTVEELAEALRNQERSGTFISKELRSGSLEAKPRLETARLTASEAEVLRQLANNLTVSAIASRSSRTVATISKQKASAMKKLDLHGNAQLYAYLSYLRGESSLKQEMMLP